MSVVDQPRSADWRLKAEQAPGRIHGARPQRAESNSSDGRTVAHAKNLALMLLVMAQFAMIIDASSVNVALPSIGSALHFSPTDLSWVVNAYTLCFAGFLLLGGRLADLGAMAAG